MKKIGVVAIVFASVLFVSGQAKTNKVVEANEFRLVDVTGKVRGTLGTDDIGTHLKLTDLTGEVVASLGTGTQGSSLTLLSKDPNTLISIMAVPATGPFRVGGLHMSGSAGRLEVMLDKDSGGPNLHMKGSAGIFEVTVDKESGGPNLTIEDNDGYSGVFGRSDLVVTKTGKKEQTPAASLVLFGKDKKVLWSAP